MKIEDFYLKWAHVLKFDQIQDFITDLNSIRAEFENSFKWVSMPPTEQGWYWAVPRMPEDAHPDMICVWCDDLCWSYGEQGRSASYYKKFAGPIIRPAGWDIPVCKSCRGTGQIWISTDVPGRAGPLINTVTCTMCGKK